MNLLLALFLITFEAVFEGLKIAGYHIASEVVELVYLAGVTLVCFAWVNKTPWFTILPIRSFLKIIIGYLFLRFSLFDLVWNISAGQAWDFYGTTKLYDQFMNTLGGFGQFLKFCSLIWGIAWLTRWGNK